MTCDTGGWHVDASDVPEFLRDALVSQIPALRLRMALALRRTKRV
jgi:hypothetical protein